MRFSLASMVPPLIVAFGALGVTPCIAQTRVASLEELQRELAAGDFITVVTSAGRPVAGRLIRLDGVELEVRPAETRTSRDPGPRVTMPLTAIHSIERPRDSARNGALLGAGIGAGAGGAMFITALLIDRNEIDEWAPAYAGAAAICTGIGALVGWAIDAANSKPHIRFDASSGGRTTVNVGALYSRGPGIMLAVSFSR